MELEGSPKFSAKNQIDELGMPKNEEYLSISSIVGRFFPASTSDR